MAAYYGGGDLQMPSVRRREVQQNRKGIDEYRRVKETKS